MVVGALERVAGNKAPDATDIGGMNLGAGKDQEEGMVLGTEEIEKGVEIDEVLVGNKTGLNTGVLALNGKVVLGIAVSNCTTFSLAALNSVLV